MLRACTQPVEDANQDTHDEAAALERLGIMQCKHAPRLPHFASDTLQPGTHEEEIAGGFIVYTLMTKMPGKRLTCENFWSRPLKDREEIRAAFKEALLYVEASSDEYHNY
tara:strand:+ start:8213 stop:8542 length:330 start_codon:yes stop_codon:yes gene_type:complete